MDDLETCMRCGFCRASCPVFEETLIESGTARGKIAIIHAMLRGELEPSKGVAKKIFECTLCGNCSDSCPAGVDVPGIFIAARKELLTQGTPLRKKAAFTLLENKRSLSALAKASKIVPDRFLSLPEKGFVSKPDMIGKSKEKVVFFTGCLVNYFIPDIKDAAVEVLGRDGVETLVIEESCCGAPLYFSGAHVRAARLAQKNISQIKRLDTNSIKAIVTPCPTCKIGLSKYPELLGGENRELAEAVISKTYEICEFLEKFGYDKDLGKLHRSYTVHESCHMKYGLGLSKKFRGIIGSLPGTEIREMRNPEACCGFGGLFCLDNPSLSSKINRRKISDILGTNAEGVLTPCPGCIIYIHRALKKMGKEISVDHPVQLLRDAYRTKGKERAYR